MKIFKYWACHLHTQHVFEAACYSLKPDMRWAISQNPNNRLMALVAAGGEYIEDNSIFLVEKCHRLLEIKGFGHKVHNNLRIRASFHPHN